MCQFRTNLCITVVLILNGFLCDIDLMENMKGISRMANAVEKMFDMTLFNSLAYFPNHATNPDKFWEATEELESELGIKIDISNLCCKASPEQLKSAKRFCQEYAVRIKKNPFDFERINKISNGHGCMKEYLSEFTLFQCEIKAFFKYYMRILTASEANKKVLHVLS